jgi:hypothetical protein
MMESLTLTRLVDQQIQELTGGAVQAGGLSVSASAAETEVDHASQGSGNDHGPVREDRPVGVETFGEGKYVS